MYKEKKIFCPLCDKKAQRKAINNDFVHRDRKHEEYLMKITLELLKQKIDFNF